MKKQVKKSKNRLKPKLYEVAAVIGCGAVDYTMSQAKAKKRAQKG